MQFLSERGVAILGCAQTKLERRSGQSAIELAGEALGRLLDTHGIDRSRIDGLACTPAMSEAGNAMWSYQLIESLGLQVGWCQLTDLGGASNLANIARAAMAIHAGACELVVCISADAISSSPPLPAPGGRAEFLEPLGWAGPTTAFGLISNVYEQCYGYPHRGLASLAVAQRTHALLNPITCEVLRRPLAVDDYLASPFVATPLRKLDCVMRCDGGSAVLVANTKLARAMGFSRLIHPISYGEISNFQRAGAAAEFLHTGFSVVGPRVLRGAGLGVEQIRMFQPYDDFLIAVMLQLEDIGFCERGQAGDFLMRKGIGIDGALPINTGGGQLSSGQPGYAGGNVNLCEAIEQLLERAGPRQVTRPRNALVTGLGVIPYASTWGVSNAMVLEQAA